MREQDVRGQIDQLIDHLNEKELKDVLKYVKRMAVVYA